MSHPDPSPDAGPPGPDAGPPADRPDLSHVDAAGRARMVDVTGKPETARRALAEGRVRLGAATLRRVLEGDVAKGPVLETARIAGIQAAKRTWELIPLCHPLPLGGVRVDLEPEEGVGIRITAEARTSAPTGVEMEALTAVAVAALTVYDMLKAIDKGIEIEGVRLLEKDGGKSGPWRRGGEGA